jgi:hypothetical protein
MGVLAAWLVGSVGPSALAAEPIAASHGAHVATRYPVHPVRRASSPRRLVVRMGGRDRAWSRLPDAPQELLPVIAPDMRAAIPSDPRAACLAATGRAEAIHGVPRGLLTAIALAESGLHAYALSIGGRAYFPLNEEAARVLYAGARPHQSVMAGCLQVNARVHARNSFWPLDPVRSADWAGGLLARWARETGSWPEALRRWHGGSPAATRRLVCRVRAEMEVTSPGSTLFNGYTCNSMHDARIRRSGAAHFATARRLSI